MSMSFASYVFVFLGIFFVCQYKRQKCTFSFRKTATWTVTCTLCWFVHPPPSPLHPLCPYRLSHLLHMAALWLCQCCNHTIAQRTSVFAHQVFIQEEGSESPPNDWRVQGRPRDSIKKEKKKNKKGSSLAHNFIQHLNNLLVIQGSASASKSRTPTTTKRTLPRLNDASSEAKFRTRRNFARKHSDSDERGSYEQEGGAPTASASSRDRRRPPRPGSAACFSNSDDYPRSRLVDREQSRPAAGMATTPSSASPKGVAPIIVSSASESESGEMRGVTMHRSREEYCPSPDIVDSPVEISDEVREASEARNERKSEASERPLTQAFSPAANSSPTSLPEFERSRSRNSPSPLSPAEFWANFQRPASQERGMTTSPIPSPPRPLPKRQLVFPPLARDLDNVLKESLFISNSLALSLALSLARSTSSSAGQHG